MSVFSTLVAVSYIQTSTSFYVQKVNANEII
jgi:hypothetical protein